MKEYAIPISITLLILIAGGVYYFQTIVPEQNLIKNSGDLYNDAKFKVAFSPEGNMKIFVNAKNNELAKLKISEGSSIPESTSIVMGAAEAQMMQEEKLFTNIGDEIKGLFGVDVKIGGILKQRGDFTDDVHFISDTQFTQLLGDESRISTKVAPDGALKVFYVYNNEELPKLKLKEGNVVIL